MQLSNIVLMKILDFIVLLSDLHFRIHRFNQAKIILKDIFCLNLSNPNTRAL